MKLSDERLIEFFWKSPVRSFPAMLDALRYLDGRWTHEECEYELFDEALGDNPEERLHIRVPSIGGISANALLRFTWHAKAFSLVRRRLKSPGALARGEASELVVIYELTPSGSYVVKALEVLTDVAELADHSQGA